MKTKSNIVVVGAGAWGTALAIAANRATNTTVTLLARNNQQARQITDTRENKQYLPNIKLDAAIDVTADPSVLKNSNAILWVVPTQVTREMIQKLVGFIPSTVPIILCCKGIEVETFTLPTDIIKSIIPNPLAVLSGPNFANEIAQGLPAAATLACLDDEIGEKLSTTLRSSSFRIYLSNDVIGVQVAGALKNVIAIASGIVVGKGLGNNARAALITRGLAEIKRLALAMGADEKTFLGLAAVGDLLLSCSSEQSRNMKFGMLLGQGATVEDAIKNSSGVVEGYYTAKAAFDLAQLKKIEIPICQSIYRILYENEPVNSTIKNMLSNQRLWEHE